MLILENNLNSIDWLRKEKDGPVDINAESKEEKEGYFFKKTTVGNETEQASHSFVYGANPCNI